jgi:hypothetical protein
LSLIPRNVHHLEDDERAGDLEGNVPSRHLLEDVHPVQFVAVDDRGHHDAGPVGGPFACPFGPWPSLA